MVSKRKCVICNESKNSGEIYVFEELLRDLEIEGRLAHPVCVMEEQAERKRKIRKCGGAQR